MQPTSATPTGSAVPGPAPGEGHTARSMDQSLAGLRLHAVEMGGLVIDQVARATEALLGRDAVLAESVLSREPLVNDYDTRLDEDSLTFIALQQPVANDLRMTRAIARSALELERVGDEAAAVGGLGPRWSDLRAPWHAAMRTLLDEAVLAEPAATAFRSAGRHGRHSEHMGRLLAEMQYLQRAYPGGAW